MRECLAAVEACAVHLHSFIASFPGPAQLSIACSTEKRGEPDTVDFTSLRMSMSVKHKRVECYRSRTIYKVHACTCTNIRTLTRSRHAHSK